VSVLGGFAVDSASDRKQKLRQRCFSPEGVWMSRVGFCLRGASRRTDFPVKYLDFDPDFYGCFFCFKRLVGLGVSIGDIFGNHSH